MCKFGILIAVLLGACTHAAKDFSSSIERRQCHQAREFIPESQPLTQLTDSASFIARNAAAYSYVGLNYGAEVMLDASAAVGMTVALCSPYLLAAALSHSYPHSTGTNSVCLPWPDNTQIWSPPLGRNAMKTTQGLRCPNITDYSRSLELVADCHESFGTQEHLKQALATLDEIQSEKYFIYCTDFSYQQRLAEKREMVQKKLTSLSD